MSELPSDRRITYQQSYRRCGKAAQCATCRDGNGHGPYWYAFYREGGKLKSVYIGKVRPSEKAEERP